MSKGFQKIPAPVSGGYSGVVKYSQRDGIAEGNAESSVREKRLYQIAFCSLKECQTNLRLIKNKDEVIEMKANPLGACLYKLMKSEIRTVQNESEIFFV